MVYIWVNCFVSPEFPCVFYLARRLKITLVNNYSLNMAAPLRNFLAYDSIRKNRNVRVLIIINKIIVLSARKRYSIIFLRGHFVCYPHCQGDFNTSQLCWQLRIACFVRNAISFMPFVTALVLKVTTCMNGTQQFWVHQSPSTKEEYFSWIFIFQQIILLNHPRYEWKYYLNIWSGFFKIHRVSVFSLFPREEIVIL